jgi:beta-galactosidase/beta-glucuronidase
MFRGVCRLALAESGRCTSRSLSLHDVHLIKDMNMNAVRMSHIARRPFSRCL